MKIEYAKTLASLEAPKTLPCHTCNLNMTFVQQTPRFMMYHCPNNHRALLQESKDGLTMFAIPTEEEARLG